jgi:hypothetical protein
MRKPNFITFTGLDARTDLHRVQKLSDLYPVEWGTLFSPKQQGVHNRYPDVDTVVSISLFLSNERHIMSAAHVCGAHARTIMAGDIPDIDFSPFSRIQVNHTAPDAEVLAAFQTRVKPNLNAVIAQVRGDFPTSHPIFWLYDPSGGKGISQKEWPVHTDQNVMVGYAGGINPSNISDVVEQIGSRTGQGPYWLDMESGVRSDDDWLDLDKCENILSAVYGR